MSGFLSSFVAGTKRSVFWCVRLNAHQGSKQCLLHLLLEYFQEFLSWEDFAFKNYQENKCSLWLRCNTLTVCDSTGFHSCTIQTYLWFQVRPINIIIF